MKMGKIVIITMSRFRLFLRSTLAAAAVEFGFIAPVLLVLVLGSIEFGLITFTFISAETAARDVTRRLSLNQITTSQASGIACSELPSWIGPCSACVAPPPSGCPTATQSACVSPTQSAPTDPPNNQFTVCIAIPATKATPTNVLSWAYGTVTLKAAVTMQQEPSS